MPIYVDTIPQKQIPIVIVTLKQVVELLPDKIEYATNFWLGDKLIRFGQTADNIIFYVDQAEEPTAEMRQYFNKLIEPLGKTATVLNSYRDTKFAMMRIYNDGRLIIDRTTLSFTELPSQTKLKPFLTSQEVLAKLPKEIPWKYKVYLTGGLVRNGWSANDGDIIIFDQEARADLPAIRKYFSDICGWRFDVGQSVMVEREPVYLYKIYEDGNLCQY